MSRGTRQTHITAVVCSLFVQQLDVDVTFLPHTFEIDTQRPLHPHEQTAHFWSDHSFDPTHSFLPLNITDDTFNSFFHALIWGKDGMPAQ
jgi:hypothetical protein